MPTPTLGNESLGGFPHQSVAESRINQERPPTPMPNPTLGDGQNRQSGSGGRRQSVAISPIIIPMNFVFPIKFQLQPNFN